MLFRAIATDLDGTLLRSDGTVSARTRAAVDAAEQVTGRRVSHAVLKGRTNYACLHKVIGGTADDQGSLIDAGDVAESLRSSRADAASVLGAEVVAMASPRPRRGGRPSLTLGDVASG